MRHSLLYKTWKVNFLRLILVYWGLIIIQKFQGNCLKIVLGASNTFLFSDVFDLEESSQKLKEITFKVLSDKTYEWHSSQAIHRFKREVQSYFLASNTGWKLLVKLLVFRFLMNECVMQPRSQACGHFHEQLKSF